jgi:hypothetical protein
VLLLPGLALARPAARRAGLAPADALAAAPGVGVLLVTLLWWLASLVRLPVSGALLGAGLALAAAGLALAAARPARQVGAGAAPPLGAPAADLAEAGWLALLSAATLVVRLATIRDLALPAWVDGVHHTYLTALLIALGGVPADYGPLLPFGPFAYHFGFHALAASAAQLAGAAPADAVLAAGQLLSAAAAPTAYLLARLYGGSPRAALAAGAIAGLVSVMPAYYVSWSRFTELAGLVALPAWLLLARRLAAGRLAALAAGLATAGLLLVHPRVLLMALALGLADLLLNRAAWARPPAARGRAAAGALSVRALLAAAVASAVAAPWAARLLGSLVPRLGVAPPGVEHANALELTAISTAADPAIYGLAAAAAVAGALLGARGPRVALLWLALVAPAANPSWLGLPGSYMLSNGAVVIALWLPAAALAGAGLVRTAADLAASPPIAARLGRLAGADRRLVEHGAALLIVLAGLALSDGASRTLNPGTVLASAEDRRALAAAARVLPADALVAVAVREWQLQTYMGADAGYYVGVLTPGRAVVPPVLYGLGPPEWARAISADLADLERSQLDPAALTARMRRTGADYLYVGSLSPLPPAERAALAGAAELETLVAEGEARLYRLRRP